MSGFECKNCSKITNIFSCNGGDELAKEYGIKMLFKIKINEDGIEEIEKILKMF